MFDFVLTDKRTQLFLTNQPSLSVDHLRQGRIPSIRRSQYSVLASSHTRISAWDSGNNGLFKKGHLSSASTRNIPFLSVIREEWTNLILLKVISMSCAHCTRICGHSARKCHLAHHLQAIILCDWRFSLYVQSRWPRITAHLCSEVPRAFSTLAHVRRNILGTAWLSYPRDAHIA